MINAIESSSTRPYLIRALYEWCTDNGLTPYVAVLVDDTVQVPREYVKNGEIVLNISFDATSSLKLGNDFIEFKARFAGTAREINVPVGRVIAIYARENGQGMAFPAPAPAGARPAGEGAPAPSLQALAPATPRATLRDASRGNEGDASKVVHLVASDDALSGDAPGAKEEEDAGESIPPLPGAAADDVSPDEPPPRPPTGTGRRPSLKRVK